MATLVEDLERLVSDANGIAKQIKPEHREALDRGDEVAEHAARAFCGSWIGYHSRIYYEGMQPPPPGAHFSAAWGMMSMHTQGTVGDWCEYQGDQLYDSLVQLLGTPSLEHLFDVADAVVKQTSEPREELLSILDACTSRSDDAYLDKLKERARSARALTPTECLARYRPTGTFMTHDSVAMSQGQQVPPHIQLQVKIDSIKGCFRIPESLAQLAKRAASHLGKKQQARGLSGDQGSKVFIGHGRSAAWRELKDFIEDRLGLEADEFNRVPVAGITNITRLSEMLDEAAVAFLVMTAEDEQADATMHPRMNVVHEAGLFQGRLGFSRAIIVLEEGCEAFSNIEGLGQIRYPKGRIKAAFEEVRQVLERESLVEG